MSQIKLLHDHCGTTLTVCMKVTLQWDCTDHERT